MELGAVSAPEFFLFLPQMRFGIDDIVERAVAAESSGFRGISFMDHLAPPLAESSPMYEAITLATWVAARTTDLIVSHLVLCDAFRHPAVLARQAVTLDHASLGRFELGLGSGSVPDELLTFGVTTDGTGARITRLADTLELLEAWWTGETVDRPDGRTPVVGARQLPTPLGRIPITIGGSGPRTLELVRRHADWWNLPVHQLDRLDDLRPHVGDARVSTQHLVAFVPDAAVRDEVAATATRRFGGLGSGLVIGEAGELVEHFGTLRTRGIERFHIWFADFAPPATLEAFGAGVIAALG